jgi:tetratricopeptide (TPR) repeat protein
MHSTHLMLRQKLLVSGTIIVALIALGIALHQRSEKQKTAAALADSLLQQQMLKASVVELENQLTLATQRLAVSEKKSSLNNSMSGKQLSSTAEPVKITHAYVESRYKHAQELVKSGHYEEALAEFLWCYEVGMPPIAGYGGVRYSYLLSNIAKLGEKYPPALAALRERRDQNEQELTAGSTDFDVIQGFQSINTALGEKKSLLQYYDRIPADDPGKQTMGLLVYDELANAQRYAEAAQIKSFRDMMGWFEDLTEMSESPKAKLSENEKKHASQVGAGFVEVLAGAGKLSDARDLAEIIRAYDSSPETATMLEINATRAGQPNLFAPIPAQSVAP